MTFSESEVRGKLLPAESHICRELGLTNLFVVISLLCTALFSFVLKGVGIVVGHRV